MIRVLQIEKPEEIRRTLEALQVDEVGVGMMTHKAHFYLLEIDSINVPAGNILKQEMLSLGGDAALHKGACDFSVKETPCLLMGTHQHYLRLSKKLLLQPFGLKKIGKEIRQTVERYLEIPPPVKAGRFTLDFSGKPLIMGILNVTPDSFSGDGMGKDIDALVKKAEKMIGEGADILDVGGESTRPGHEPVGEEEELKRVIPAVDALAKKVPVPISIDTSKGKVALRALESGASIINDVWGLSKDPEMLEAAASSGAPVVVTHNKESASYGNLMEEIHRFFHERLQTLEKSGVAADKVILDPGIGFGKTAAHNLTALKNFGELRGFGRPLLLGASRKSFIQALSGAKVEARLPGSLAAASLALAGGCHIFRVHDVAETRQALAVARAILQGESDG